MRKVKIVSIIYAIGIIIGALFFDVWGADTTPLKTLSVFAWTVIFIIALFFVDKNESCLLYTSPSPRDISGSRMPSSA